MTQIQITSKPAAIISFLIYIIFITWLASAVDASFDQVLLAFAPTLLFWAILTFLPVPHREIIMGIGPLVLAAAFFILASSQPNTETITGINVVLMYLFSLIFFLLRLRQKKGIPEEQVIQIAKDAGDKKYYEEMAQQYAQQNQQYQQQIQALQAQMQTIQQTPTITQENFNITLRGIEDKCKALNASIGRVYSDKHGGNPKVRAILNIDRELYNRFSELAADFSSENAAQLLQVLTSIQEKLRQLVQPEKDVISLLKSPMNPLDRDSSGNDMILEVLAKNDKDPVKDYYSEATEVCEKVIAYLKSAQPTSGSATQ